MTTSNAGFAKITRSHQASVLHSGRWPQAMLMSVRPPVGMLSVTMQQYVALPGEGKVVGGGLIVLTQCELLATVT